MENNTLAKFVLVVENDVGMQLVPGNNEFGPQAVACLRSNPTIVEVEPLPNQAAKFNFIVDGDVGLSLDIPIHPTNARWIACLRSNPQIIEVPVGSPMAAGWTYDGTDFYPPA
jgi:hypothetical protein